MTMIDARRALGAFLRAHRERRPPPPSASGRRRTPGLRREEVAEACGVSLTWITWLEQGRDVSASPRCAGAPRRSASARAGRARLSVRTGGKARSRRPRARRRRRCRQPNPRPARPDDDSRLSARSAVDRAAWNQRRAALFVGWLDGEHDRNLLRFIFLSTAARTPDRGLGAIARAASSPSSAPISAGACAIPRCRPWSTR